MTRTGFITDKTKEALSWEWQDLEAIYADLIPKVPPGKALRKYEQRYTNQRANHQWERESPLPETERIYSGARDLVRASMRGLIENGYAERCEVDGKIMIRRKDRRVAPAIVQEHHDGCEACGRPFVKPRKSAAQTLPTNVIQFAARRQLREAEKVASQ